MKPKNSPRITPKVKGLPKIGKPKFSTEIKSLENIDVNRLNKISFYKAPGEKTVNITGDRLNSFTVIDSKKFDAIFKNINQKRTNAGKESLDKKKGTIFYFKLQDPKLKGRYNNGNAIPDLFSLIDSMFKYPKTRHGYDVMAVVSPEKKVLGYTTVKINHAFMKKILPEIENKSVKNRDNFTRKMVHLLSNMQGNIKNKETVFNVLKVLDKIGFEVYFTPEKGYKLDKEYRFVRE